MPKCGYVCYECKKPVKDLRNGCPVVGQGWRCDACWKKPIKQLTIWEAADQ